MSAPNLSRTENRRRWLKLGVFCVGVAVLAVAGYLVWEQTPDIVFLRARLGFHIALECLYVATVVGCVLGAPSFALALMRGPRRPLKTSRAARGLTLCVSLLFAFLIVELAAGIVRARRARASAVPVGGLHRTSSEKPVALPKAFDDPELPREFPERKGPDDVEIVMLGESSAAGIPYTFFDLSPGALVCWRLQEAIPGKHFFLRTIATSGDTLEGQHAKLASLRRRPDVVVIYCGHNEFAARLHDGRTLDYYHDADPPSFWVRAVDRIEAASPFCGLLRTSADICRIQIPPDSEYGNRTLVDSPLYTSAEYDALLADFRRRLDAIIVYVQSLGALPILLAPPANDAGFEPSRSYLPAETRHETRAAFARDVTAARLAERSDPTAAIATYRALIARFPGFAETHFRLARLLEHAGDYESAYGEYILARDHDGAPHRCPTVFQDAYHAVASSRGCPLIDGQAYFHAVGPHGLLDDHLFHDGMHPSLRGQVALARGILRVLHARRAFGWPADAPAPTLNCAATARRFKLGSWAWNKVCHWGIMFYDLMSPIRFDPTERRAKQDAFGKAADAIAAGRPAESVGLPNIGVPDESNPE